MIMRLVKLLAKINHNNLSMIYLALLRGIGPLNPNMRAEKLREFFESLGFKNVQTVIATGNILFESNVTDSKKLEEKIETALPKKLGFTSTTIVRSRDYIKKLVDAKPFGKTLDTPNSRLNVTFLKRGGEEFSIIDTTSTKTPDIMRQLEKKHGKEITTRTWKTIDKILKKLNTY
jgi:uncharacterized protein (DUF1697 family)